MGLSLRFRVTIPPEHEAGLLGVDETVNLSCEPFPDDRAIRENFAAAAYQFLKDWYSQFGVATVAWEPDIPPAVWR